MTKRILCIGKCVVELQEAHMPTYLRQSHVQGTRSFRKAQMPGDSVEI